MKVGDTHELVLPPAMSTAVQAAALPGFKVWGLQAYEPDVKKYYPFTSRQAPWAVIGDFNGDGLPDVIVDGHTGQSCYRLCVWGGIREPKVEMLNSRKCREPLWRVVMYAAPGEQRTNFSDETIFIYADGYMDYHWEKAGSTWYWEEGKWNEFVSSD